MSQFIICINSDTAAASVSVNGGGFDPVDYPALERLLHQALNVKPATSRPQSPGAPIQLPPSWMDDLRANPQSLAQALGLTPACTASTPS